MISHPLISCKNNTLLSEFVSYMVPTIWTGTPFTTTNRSNAFKLFCQNILKLTRVSNSCVLLSLYYIYKLKNAYPSIQGSMGSEVRLFTTALILSNKFLDDNTFTNKTWSDVSSVPLSELNIMEIEFLSALNYRIYIHPSHFFSWISQCQQWLTQLMSATLLTPSLMRPVKRSGDHLSGHQPWKRAHYDERSLPSQHYYYPAASVATLAAATAAMNVNYSIFIPRVNCLEIE
ncbi:cyclin-domain-containing protein [Pilobolus umbonatus]|nr:cyclin-domain-containing protein [Pilobolus umbonatus]